MTQTTPTNAKGMTMTTGTRFSWDFPETLTHCRETYRMVPQTRRDATRVSSDELNEVRNMVGAAFDGTSCLPVPVDFADWFGWMIVPDMESGTRYAVLVEYSDRDGTFPHQWCRVVSR